MAEVNEEGLRDLSVEAICARLVVSGRVQAINAHDGHVREALAQLGYRCGKYGVSVDEWNHAMSLGMRAVRSTEDPHDFELVFELRGHQRRVEVQVA